ncbi:hypothetical protein C7I55_07475 [Sphingomonas deserti]|uniref:Uncharacterized protein n=2 Tax=Allosphingosinicella deserti TaxID=2116704 RepID=A0A2P7QVS4_9SPHN|nr:hypothetical protein C7I55_07475 [Sphingomonas deserti]
MHVAKGNRSMFEDLAPVQEWSGTDPDRFRAEIVGQGRLCRPVRSDAGGVPVSVVSLDEPGFDRFPLYRDAIAAATSHRKPSQE